MREVRPSGLGGRGGVQISSPTLIAEYVLILRTGFVVAEGAAEGFAAIEADEVGEEANLRGRPFVVRAVHLPVDVAGVYEKDVSAPSGERGVGFLRGRRAGGR
jgi:hypothetical protein